MKQEYVKPTLEVVEGKVIEGFPKYIIYRNGKVFSKKTNQFVGNLRKDGYMEVTLSNGNKRRQCGIHQLVAETFIPKPESDIELVPNHKNRIHNDNRVENLEWVTRKGNQNYPPTVEAMREAKRSKMKKIQCLETGEIFESIKDAVRKMGLKQSSLSHHLNRPNEMKSLKGYHFKFYPIKS